MKKAAAWAVALGLAAMLTLPAPAGADERANASLLRTRGLLNQAAEDIDAAAAAASVDIQFGGGEETGTEGTANPAKKRSKKKMSETAKLLEQARDQTTALHDHVKLVPQRLRRDGPERDAKRARNLKKHLKKLKDMLNAIHSEKPQRDLWAVLAAEKLAEKVHRNARDWADQHTRGSR